MSIRSFGVFLKLNWFINRNTLSKMKFEKEKIKKNSGKVYRQFFSSWIDTPLGPMLAIADEKSLMLLEFADRHKLEIEVEKLEIKMNATVRFGRSEPISSIKKELKLYFGGLLKEFRTPIFMKGSVFQEMVWRALFGVPYGETRSYLDHASAIGRVSACRAVANAIGANRLAVVIPCHRIINNNGKLGGYAGGKKRKQWLIDHEKEYLNFYGKT